MAYLVNDPNDFTDELIDGFVAANSGIVRRVPGGVARAQKSATPAVAIVTGGGSGHYPAFGGLVGHGLADGAAMGNIFASPSAQQVYSVAKAVTRGKGVLLTYGNYAGDVLNFNRAQERLRDEGIDCRTVVVTDDISSASPTERSKRRGIAGDLTVFKCAAAAAGLGYDMDAVEQVAKRANDRTRSIGVAFSGCTLPGADTPLFSVPEGKMAVGMGIHGEPGISEVDMPTADELATLMVDQLWAEIPDGVSPEGAKLVVLVNGLGSVKYEELFVLYNRVSQLVEARGVTIIEPEVGELVTSFEMAGASLTFFWVDDELESLWAAPAYTPAFRKGSLHTDLSLESLDADELAGEQIPEASAVSREAAAKAVVVIEAIGAVIDANADELGRLDSIAGDGDHGIGMQRGAQAAVVEARRVAAAEAGVGTLLGLSGAAWADRAGGTSGALWGEILTTIGARLGDAEPPTAAALAEAVTQSAAAVTRYGGAKVGDKTLLDALVPFAEALTLAAASSPDSIRDAWAASVAPAEAAASATADLLPKVGRARPHLEKSLGTPDPGAVSMALIISAVANTL
ncbi:dihydroxyacetone kinase family protein [Lysinibacter cavernae]|uniref:Dihydroxyacetone kinase n=1 Tax=Lysinibacter cavernae TaxID=1640652 RepID=A0A7X5R1G7_9MICO|nr:dihydroxyacetone kinase family protein [Lysinibacter cavernae]NIH53955.1 dihydroxyacetone kinase [Lysinibacter cavernae]